MFPLHELTKQWLFCVFVKRLAYFAQNIHFNGCNFLNNSPVYTLLLRWLPSCWTYKFSLVRTIVHVYCFPWPRVQLSFVRTTCTYKGMLVRTNSYLVRTIVHVYCFPWPRVQLSFVRTTCTYKGMLVRTNSWSETVVRTSINFVRAKQIFLFVQSSCTCNCTCKGFSFYRGADTCTAHFCYGGFSRISGRSVCA